MSGSVYSTDSIPRIRSAPRWLVQATRLVLSTHGYRARFLGLTALLFATYLFLPGRYLFGDVMARRGIGAVLLRHNTFFSLPISACRGEVSHSCAIMTVNRTLEPQA